MVGHVDHGKTTLTQSLSGKWTDTHSEEIRKGITIRLGYADFTIYKCDDCPEPDCYSISDKNPKCKKKAVPVRKVSIVDAPGHESLMATMLSGAAIIDAAFLLVAANEQCPQPQTREHLVALQIIGIKNVVVIQNKIDLVSAEQALKNYNEIKAFLKGNPFESAPIIPISAQRNVNIDLLLSAVQNNMPPSQEKESAEPLLFIARSFDVNRPGISPKDLTGGVIGGTVKQGIFKIGDEIEMRPGRVVERKGRTQWEPVKTKITGLKAGN